MSPETGAGILQIQILNTLEDIQIVVCGFASMSAFLNLLLYSRLACLLCCLFRQKQEKVHLNSDPRS